MIPSVKAAKRLIDVTGAAIGLAASAPLIVAIAVAICIDSPGPILFRQRRAGTLRRVLQGNREPFEFDEFQMFKFRSMHVDAEKHSGPVLAEENDPRVFRVGRFLRKTRLDELPQLVNVLRGDMSLVGPRPERPELLVNLAHAIPFFEERMRGVKPGITGLAQVSLGYTGNAKEGSEVHALKDTLTNPYKIDDADGALADDMRLKLLYDMAYAASLERLSSFLRTELSVIIKTPIAMFRGLGR
ncbi:MAG: sugar transferase [Deltaproteobacteria bacterium]|nr:sugar transferase [Deltaproteobacteria bacterium]